MANQAQKKMQKNAEIARKTWGIPLLISQAIFFVLNMVFGGSLWTFAATTAVCFCCWYWIVDRTANGAKFQDLEYPRDIVMLTVIVEFLATLLSAKFWFVLLLVPTIAIYKVGKLVVKFVFNSPQPEE
eukprot:TRINITY_DN556309_c0_g1_i1.p1 TRINITY_DN556309_c0_g1~~TRINITY_DN556309_c0_g1_i1.p1  ORF type:complete len:128 (+),score=32.98 TRINITY_DN556309_c0_g1_i1:47-430(+)